MSFVVEVKQDVPEKLSQCTSDAQALAWAVVNRDVSVVTLDNDATWVSDSRWDGDYEPDEEYALDGYTGNHDGVYTLLELLGVEVFGA